MSLLPVTSRNFIYSPRYSSGMASFDRIEKFLLGPSRDDRRHGNQKSSHALIESTNIRPEEATLAEPLLVDLTAALLIDSVTVSLCSGSEPVLSDISIRLETSSITMIAGSIGSGKSTLLKAILGEVPFTGNIFVSSKRISYCSQTPWLINGTIRKNILGLAEESEFDELWYRTVMHACVLDEDLALLPEGDQSEIGSRGLSLSGGQKQRVVSSCISLGGRFNSSPNNHSLGACTSDIFQARYSTLRRRTKRFGYKDGEPGS